MANTNVTMRIDENLKSQLQELVSNLGMDMTTFFTMAAKQAVREQALPFHPDMNVGRYSDKAYQMAMRKGEVWFVEFPLEEDASRIINRPVIVLDENVLGVLSVKITKHKVRKEDPYDIPIIYWSEAGLRLASTARVSKVTVLNKDSFIFKIGNLHNDDMDRIEAMYSKFLEDNNII